MGIYVCKNCHQEIDEDNYPQHGDFICIMPKIERLTHEYVKGHIFVMYSEFVTLMKSNNLDQRAYIGSELFD